MHRIDCPNCQKSLKLPHEVRNARLKCSKCGHVFVGSSYEEGQSPVQPAGPAVDNGDVPIDLEAARVQRPQIMYAVAPRRSKAPGIITIVGAMLIVCLIAGLAFVSKYKHVILKDADGNIVKDLGWVPNEEGQKAVQEWSRKKDKSDKSGQSAATSKTAGGEASSGTVSEGGLVGVAMVQGDKEFALENHRIIADEVGEGGVYVGVVWNKHDTVIEKVTLMLKCGQETLKPVTLHWIAPGGRVPFTVSFPELSPQQRAQAPIAIFEGVLQRKDMSGWDIPSSEPIDSVSDDKKTITITGIATNRTSGPVRAAKLYADFITDEGVVQGSVLGEMKLSDLTPEAKTDYTVTYNPTLIGQPHKFFLRVIGTR